MPEDRLQLQRFELKYLVREETALAVREFVRSYLELDEYGVTMPNLSYPVHSLYLDSKDLDLYHITINGDKNRFKLRLRFYDDKPSSPIFFEIKRRTNNTISKQRGAVKREAVPLLLAGHLPAPEHLWSNSPRHLAALQRFCHLMLELHATPAAHIAYKREAWISRNDNSIRVTLDRDVQCARQSSVILSTHLKNPVHVFSNEVILELKFTDRFPDWFKTLVRVFGLMQCGAAKYVEGIGILGEKSFQSIHPAPHSLEDLRDDLPFKSLSLSSLTHFFT